MVKETTCYQSSDGKMYETLKEAEDHQEDLIASAFYELVSSAMPYEKFPQISRSDWFDAQVNYVDQLKNDRAGAVKRLNRLINSIDWD